MWRPQPQVSSLGTIPALRQALPLARISLIKQEQLASNAPRDSPVSASQHWDYKVTPPCLSFSLGFWGLNSDPHVFEASSLSSKLSSPSPICGILIDREQESGCSGQAERNQLNLKHPSQAFPLEHGQWTGGRLRTDWSSHGLSMSLGQLSLPYIREKPNWRNRHGVDISMLFVMSEGGGLAVEDELGVVFHVAFPELQGAQKRVSAGHLHALRCVSFCHSSTRLLLV